jgi:thioesterase domain-containing protein/NAD(P)-dependent dehydrogenase (short-subunit alcohol dehydrogenase family)
MQQVFPSDVCAYEKTPLLGLLRTMPQEHAQLSCRHIDLPVGDIHEQVAYLLNDICDLQEEPEVAYRSGHRWCRRLEAVDVRATRWLSPPFKRGGMYLMSGGLGGIGIELAKHLLTHYQVRLLIVGRTPLEVDPPTAEGPRRQAYQALQQLPGDIRYRATDICDEDRLRLQVEQAKAHWGCELDGVIHLAGLLQSVPLSDEQPTSLATTLRAKMLGTWVLHQLLRHHPGGIFISFSSVNAFFGGATVGAYAAANRFLESYTRYQQSRGAMQSYCLSWSMWEETGMSRGYPFKALSRVHGYQLLTVQQGLEACLTGLRLQQPDLMIGLDDRNPHIQPYVETAVYPIVSRNARARPTPPAPCAAASPHQLSALQETLRDMFADVLEQDQIGLNDNFFERGGHSLLATRLVARIAAQLQPGFPLSQLFETPTVAGIATWLQAHRAQGEAAAHELPSCLIPIQPHGVRPPLFCIHPGSGSPQCYVELARYLDGEQPVYGFELPNRDQGKPRFDVENLASTYIDAMRQVQPAGPYRIGGWSFGGLVAFEMARQLEAQGETLALVALFEGGVLDIRASTRMCTLVNVLRIATETLLCVCHMKLPTSYRTLRVTLQPFGLNLPISRQEVTQHALRTQLHLVHQGIRRMSRSLCLWISSANAMLRYQPGSYSGQVTLFQTKRYVIKHDPILSGLRKFAARVDVQSIPGNHVILFHEERVIQSVAEQLQNCLDRLA